MSPPNDRNISISYGQLTELLEGVFHRLMKPYDDDNKKSIRGLEAGQEAMRLTFAKWSGAVIVFGLVWGLFLAFISSGGCNKIKISLDNPSQQSQNKANPTHAIEPDSTLENR